MELENTEIEFLHEYRISLREFRSLDETSQAIVAIASYAATDVNLMSKLYLNCAPSPCGDLTLDMLCNIQRLTVLRIWSSKMFEFHGFIAGIRPKGVDQEAISEIKKTSLAAYQLLKVDGGHDLHRQLRHEATNHYSYKAALKNIKFLSENANLSLLLHDLDGNSFYPLGEEVMFAGRLNRFTSNRRTLDERLAATDEWMRFNLEASKWLRDTTTKLISFLLLDKFPKRRAYQKMYYLEKGYAAEHQSNVVPLFMRKQSKA